MHCYERSMKNEPLPAWVFAQGGLLDAVHEAPPLRRAVPAAPKRAAATNTLARWTKSALKQQAAMRLICKVDLQGRLAHLSDALKALALQRTALLLLLEGLLVRPAWLGCNGPGVHQLPSAPWSVCSKVPLSQQSTLKHRRTQRILQLRTDPPQRCLQCSCSS